MSKCQYESRTFLGVGLGCVLAAGVAASPGTELGEGLRSALEQAGWRVTQRADGGLDLRAPAETPGSPPAAAGAGAREAAVSGDATAWARLAEHGWRVERGADGSTLLYPPGTAAGPSPSEAASEPTPSESSSERLEDHLRGRGWRAERSQDGSLILYPRAAEVDATPRQPPAPCAGELTAAVRDARVSLPIASWEQARAVTESWLASVDSPGSSVGKIRQIGRVYLVSIIEARPPHRLRHQIAIDSDSGRVLVLN